MMLLQRISDFVNVLLVLISISAMGQVFAEERSGQPSVNFREIREYAGFANAAYRPVADIRDLSLSKNYTLSHYSSIPETGIVYYLLTNDASRIQVIAVRGTSNAENAILDLALKLTPDKKAGVSLHNGFALATQSVYRQIQPYLKQDYIISTTGHSLGGAVAQILAMYLDVDNYSLGQVVTFGQPKVTNITGANQFQHLKITRVVTPEDLVPLVPPLDPIDINNIDIYWHLGKEVILFPDNTYSVLEGVSSMLRATKFTQKPLTENNLNTHHMSQYVKLLDNKIPAARLVPFKHSFNLFNLLGSEQ